MSVLPDGWAWRTLGEVTTGGLFVDGDWVESKDQDPSGEVRLIQLADVGEGGFRDRSNRRLTTATAERLRCTYLAPGDVLVARMPDPLGRACIVPKLPTPAVTVVDVCVVRPSSVRPEWLMWSLNAPQVRSQVEALQSGTTRKRISRRNLATVRLAIPPLDAQERIVAAIEQHLSRIDAGVDSLVSTMRRQRALQRSVFANAQAEGEERTLGDLLLDIETGKSFRTPGYPAADGEWGVVKVSAMTWGEFDEAQNKAVPADQAVDPRHEIRKGDLLLSRANTSEYVGATVLVGECRPKLLLSDKSMRLVTAPGVERRWLRLALGSPQVRSQMSELASGTSDSMRNISQAKVRSLRIRVPSPQRQQELAMEVEAGLDGTRRVAAAVEITRRRADHLRRSVLTAAVSGRLG